MLRSLCAGLAGALLLAFSCACGSDGLSQVPRNPPVTPTGGGSGPTGPSGPSSPSGPTGPTGPQPSGPSGPSDPRIDPPEDEDLNDPPSTCQTGALTGRLCLPGADQPLAGALVYIWAIDCLGNTRVHTATAADNGQFSLAGIPEGTVTIKVEHGSYTGEFTADVVAGEIIIVDTAAPGAPLCINETPPRLAIIDGDYDEVHTILDSLSLTYDRFSSYSLDGISASPALEFLSDLQAMSAYDVIFVNCGAMERDFLAATVDYGSIDFVGTITYDYQSIAYQNLRTFVLHGGNIYASDWAWPIAEGLAPAAIDFIGDESNGANVLVGNSGPVSGRIQDNSLGLFIGTNNVAIDYDLGAWAVIDVAAVQSQVFVSGDVSYTPYDPLGFGTSQTLANRPLLVGFRPFAGGGFVLYTTFHYHAQPSAQMLDILKYLIFQL